VRGGSADRTFSEVVVTLPTPLPDRDVPLTASRAAEVEQATREITALDTSSGGALHV
jgi:hypothetical protein